MRKTLAGAAKFGAGATMAALLTASLGLAMETGAQAATLRPEVGKPLAKAVSLMRARNFAAAMAQVRVAAGARGLTPDENFVVEQTRASIAGQMGDNATAARSYDFLLNSGRVSAAQTATLLKAEASIAFNAKNYPAAINWTQKAIKASPSDAALRAQLITAYYLNKNYAEAGKLQAVQVAETVRVGRRPTEEQLQLLAACQRQGGDTAGFGNTMVQLVTYYPKPDYWENLIHSAQTRPGFNDRLTLDLDRFELETGLLTKPADLMEMIELALQVPLPAEARAIIDKGYATNVLGTGAEAPRQQRLRDLVNKTYASERAAMAGREAEAQGAHDGNLLASLGEQHVTFGEFPKGIALIQAGLRKDELRHPDDTKLHLGLAYMRAGNKAQAVKVLKTVGGKEGAAEIARLWILRLTATA